VRCSEFGLVALAGDLVRDEGPKKKARTEIGPGIVLAGCPDKIEVSK